MADGAAGQPRITKRHDIHAPARPENSVFDLPPAPRFAYRLSYLCSRKYSSHTSQAMNPISKYAHLVRFSHTIFAMPFALTSFVYAPARHRLRRRELRAGVVAVAAGERWSCAWSSPATWPWASTAGRPPHRRRESPHGRPARFPRRGVSRTRRRTVVRHHQRRAVSSPWPHR